MTDTPTYVIDDLPPPVIAMLQALYSRSPRSVMEHLEVVRRRGPDKFLATYYCGYGHKSIGDCGTTSLFIERRSLLAAKAIQDNALYNGQEASTRYLDYSSESLVNPCGTDGADIQSRWMMLYSNVLESLLRYFEDRFPRQAGQKRSVWRKAVRARAFDVARGFLPAGVRTYVAWHTNLRQANEHLKLMRHHPLTEVRAISEQAHEILSKKYPSAFSHKRYPAQESYIRASMAEWAFSDRPLAQFGWNADHLDVARLCDHRELLSSRPPKTELHPRFRQFGDIEFRFPLDFGSYRDLQRHRSCVQEMPLLTTRHGFHPWYLAQLPLIVRQRVRDVLDELIPRIDALSVAPIDRQYVIPIGFLCAVRITCSLPSAIYIAELRSGPTVHPTVREVAQQIGDTVAQLVPGLRMHHDKSPSAWNIKRGEQDIVRRDGRE